MRSTENIAGGQTPAILLQSKDIAPELADRARRTIAANATGTADARTLLEMLGLIDAPARPRPLAPNPDLATNRPYTFEWIETEHGRFRKCRGICGSAIRIRTEPNAPGTKREYAGGKCKACYYKARETHTET